MLRCLLSFQCDPDAFQYSTIQITISKRCLSLWRCAIASRHYSNTLDAFCSFTSLVLKERGLRETVEGGERSILAGGAVAISQATRATSDEL